MPGQQLRAQAPHASVSVKRKISSKINTSKERWSLTLIGVYTVTQPAAEGEARAVQPLLLEISKSNKGAIKLQEGSWKISVVVG